MASLSVEDIRIRRPSSPQYWVEVTESRLFPGWTTVVITDACTRMTLSAGIFRNQGRLRAHKGVEAVFAVL